MSVNRVHYTVEVLSHLDSDFDIPDAGVNSDVEWLDDEGFEEPDIILPADSIILPNEKVEINFWTVQI